MKILFKILFTGIKEKKWTNVHYDFESADGGAWFTSGDERLYEFTERWVYFLGLPVWRLYLGVKDKGLYDIDNYLDHNNNRYGR